MSTAQRWRVVHEDDPLPTVSNDGIEPGVPRVVWFLHGRRDHGIPLCQVELCWYDELALRWVCPGTRRAFTDDGLIEQFTYGSRVALRLTDVRGEWTLNYRRLPV